MGHGQRERLRQLVDRSEQPVLAVLLRQDVLLRGWQQPELLGWRTARPDRPVEAVEQAAADLVLREHQGDSLALIDRCAAGAAALGVGRQRRLQLVGQSEVVDNEPARIIAEHAVHARKMRVDLRMSFGPPPRRARLGGRSFIVTRVPRDAQRPVSMTGFGQFRRSWSRRGVRSVRSFSRTIL